MKTVQHEGIYVLVQYNKELGNYGYNNKTTTAVDLRRGPNFVMK